MQIIISIGIFLPELHNTKIFNDSLKSEHMLYITYTNVYVLYILNVIPMHMHLLGNCCPFLDVGVQGPQNTARSLVDSLFMGLMGTG